MQQEMSSDLIKLKRKFLCLKKEFQSLPEFVGGVEPNEEALNSMMKFLIVNFGSDICTGHEFLVFFSSAKEEQITLLMDAWQDLLNDIGGFKDYR